MGGRFDKLVLETSGGRTMEFGRAKYDVTSRGGKGFEAVKRTDFTRVVPPPIELVNWEAIEVNSGSRTMSKDSVKDQKTFFEE
jgi:DNA gyrase subunit A